MPTVRGGVRVVGLNKMLRDLGAIGIEVTDLREAFATIASEATTLAVSFAPRRSGRLAASIRGSKARNYASVRAGGSRVPYAGAINYGWAKRHIQPVGFMQRADRAIRPRALRELQRAIKHLIVKRSLS